MHLKGIRLLIRFFKSFLKCYALYHLFALSVFHRLSMRYCDICRFFCGIRVFVDIFCGVAVFGTPQCPPLFFVLFFLLCFVSFLSLCKYILQIYPNELSSSSFQMFRTKKLNLVEENITLLVHEDISSLNLKNSFFHPNLKNTERPMWKSFGDLIHSNRLRGFLLLFSLDTLRLKS